MTKTIEEQIQCPGHVDRKEGETCKICNLNHTITFELVTRDFLSKQKVRETLEKIKYWYKTGRYAGNYSINYDKLKKELGL